MITVVTTDKYNFNELRSFVIYEVLALLERPVHRPLTQRILKILVSVTKRIRQECEKHLLTSHIMRDLRMEVIQ